MCNFKNVLWIASMPTVKLQRTYMKTPFFNHILLALQKMGHQKGKSLSSWKERDFFDMETIPFLFSSGVRKNGI